MAGDALARIAATSRTARYRRHQLIERRCESALPVLVVMRGTVKVSQTLIDGRHQIIDFLSVGDILVRPPECDSPSRVVEPVTEVEACIFDLADLAGLERDAPGLVQPLLGSAFAEIDRKNDQVTMLGRKRSDERVATFLLDLANRAARRGEPCDRVLVPMTRSDIADYLGLTTETVSRALSTLRDEGLIRLPKPDRILLCDIPALVRVAGGGASLTVR